MNRSSVGLHSWAGVAGLSLLLAAPAHAQFKPRTISQPATGEKYHIEAEASLVDRARAAGEAI